MADRMSPAARSRLMSRIRSRGTAPERVLAAALAALGVVLERNDPTLPGSPDFASRSSAVAVFVHGCFWHSCPTCRRCAPRTNAVFWREKLDANRRRDARVLRRLRADGWDVVVVWEHELSDRGMVALAARRVADAVRSSAGRRNGK